MPRLVGRKSAYDFLDEEDGEAHQPFTTAPWLLSKFDENIWQVHTHQKKPITLDWNIFLSDGSCLTDEKNTTFLRSLKHILVIGANGVNDEFATLAPVSQDMRLKISLRMVDYLLINCERFDLISYGLAGLNEDNLKEILECLAKFSHAEESVYNWRFRVSRLCEEKISALTSAEAEYYYRKFPSILDVSVEEYEESGLDIPISDIPKARAALMKAGLYRTANLREFHLNSKQVMDYLYSGTLWGRFASKTAIEVLSFYPGEKLYRREKEHVRVTTGGGGRLHSTTYFIYRYVLIGTEALGQIGLPFPSEVESIKGYVPDIKRPARFRSVPSGNLLRLFRSAVEFHIQHGRSILNGFIKVASYCTKNNLNMTALPNEVFLSLIGSELRALGVELLGLSCSIRVGRPKSGREEYFSELRSNMGLLELVCVYLGSVQMVVGMIMARRVDEFVTLQALTCLDKSRSWLIFGLAKSTKRALGIRQREARPIDPIAAEMIGELQRFQKILKRLKVVSDVKNLFAAPSSLGVNGLLDCSLHLYNRHLDFACDYFESDCNEAGERYYVRQHQMRRFFAAMFFHTNSYGCLDTLRWMLGHRDIEHVWRYVTECLDAKEIRVAGARYFADLAKSDRLENYQDLKALLSIRFGVASFKLVNEDIIEDYLESLMEEGKVKIEPFFFNDENGKSMKVLFIVN